MPRIGWTSQGLGFGNLKPPYWVDTTLSTPTYNVSYSDSVYAFGATNYSIVAGSDFPNQLTLNSTTGAITGTYTSPSSENSYTYIFTIRASNSAGYVDAAFAWSISIPFTYTGGSGTFLGAGYTGVVFTSNGTFQILTGKRNLEVAVISGGSGGGGGAYDGYWDMYCGGGGGSAGNRAFSTINNATPGNYSIAIGAAGGGGARALNLSNYYSIIQGSTGGSGGTSTLTKPDTTTITKAGPTGGTGGTIRTPPIGAPLVIGGSGASNETYAGSNGHYGLYDYQAGGGGGAGAGGPAGAIPNYYTGAAGGTTNYAIDIHYSYGAGGNGGNWNSRQNTSELRASGGAGGAGFNDSTFGPGNAGVGGIILIRWIT